MHGRGEHQPYWMVEVERASFPALEGDHEFDVAVVGAGITGLTAALLLKRAGKRVAVLERRRVGSGNTGRSTGHLTTVVDSRYHRLEKSFGREGARLVAGSLRDAIDQVERFTRELSIDCAFERLPGYHYSEEGDLDTVHQELEAARRAGLLAEMTREVPLPFPTAAAFVARDQAQFQPLAYLQGMARAIEGGGCRIFEYSPVLELGSDSPRTLRSEKGSVIAPEVLVATHTPLGVNLLQTEIAPYRSYVLAARLNNVFPDALFWDTEQPYNYLRRSSAAAGDIVIVGGKDHKTAHGDERQSFDALESYLRDRFNVGEILFCWSSQYYEPNDGLPFIGRAPGARDIHVATGYSGDGLTFGTLGGMINADLILGQTNTYAELYRPTRLHLAGLGHFMSENLDNARRFIADRLSSDHAECIDKIGPGEGCVLRHDKRQLAANRDQAGTLHTFSAVCPHMKCLVRWNPAEETWDCPCHGSRFGSSGQPIEGPALTGLERKEVEGKS